MYLRENLLLDGGDHIISKYSRRAPETTVTRKLPKKVKRARTAEQTAAQRVVSPKLSPAKLLQDPGGIEGIIHEAAKGVYSQGEKWGVTKALRGAMQGLQSGSRSPRRLAHRSQSSLDSDRAVPDDSALLMAKLHTLEQRNQSLAKLLEAATEELWAQQKDIHQKHNPAPADALGLAIAKVQFVQVYLENASMPLPTESTQPTEAEKKELSHGLVEGFDEALPAQVTPLQVTQIDGSPGEKVINEDEADQFLRPSAVEVEPPPSNPKSSPVKSPSLTPSQQPRPALAQSPFSWMLGEDEPKSSFVSASPYSSDRRAQEEEGGVLFGDERKESSNCRTGSKVNGKDGR